MSRSYHLFVQVLPAQLLQPGCQATTPSQYRWQLRSSLRVESGSELRELNHQWNGADAECGEPSRAKQRSGLLHQPGGPHEPVPIRGVHLDEDVDVRTRVRCATCNGAEQLRVRRTLPVEEHLGLVTTRF